MVPLQSDPTVSLGWVAVVAIFLAPGLAAAVLCTPFLLAERVRSLFRSLPPGDWLAVPYLVVTVGGSLPYVAGTLWTLSLGADGSPDAAVANTLLDVLVGLSATYVLVVPLLVGVGLPRAGIDWDPTGYGPGTWALLVGVAAWYAAVFAVPLFVFAAIIALPT